MNKYIISIIILAFVVTVNIPALFRINDPCIYHACPDAGYGGEGLIKFVVDTTPPNFYIPAGIYCGFGCTDYPARISWGMLLLDMTVWLIATFFIFRRRKNKFT